MNAALLGIVGAFALLFLVLFLGGMLEAAWEIRQEKKAGLPVTRPAWRKEDRPVKEGPDYSAPKGTGLMWVLLALGRPDLAVRFLQWRARRKISREQRAALDSNGKVSGVAG